MTRMRNCHFPRVASALTSVSNTLVAVTAVQTGSGRQRDALERALAALSAGSATAFWLGGAVMTDFLGAAVGFLVGFLVATTGLVFFAGWGFTTHVPLPKTVT